MATKLCRVVYDLRGNFYRVYTPYKPGFKEAMHQFIPAAFRHAVYNKENHFDYWVVTDAYGDAMRKVCETVFGAGSVTFVDRAAAEAEMRAKAASAGVSGAGPADLSNDRTRVKVELVTKQFFDLIPYEAAKKAYLAGCIALHPDRNGGDGTKMSLFNLTWQRIEKEVYGK